MRPFLLAAQLVLCGLPLAAQADPAADLQRAVQLIEKSRLDEARGLLESIAASEKVPAALRAEAQLRRGCMALEFVEGGSPEARDRFGRALQLEPHAKAPEGWNPRCQELFAAVQSARVARPTVTAPAAGKADLEKERAERLKLQQRLETLNKQLSDLKQAGRDSQTADRLSQLEAVIQDLRVEVKSRDDRILSLSLKLEPAQPKPPKVFQRRLTVPTIVLGSLAVVAAGTGLGFGVSAHSSKSAFDATPYQATADGYATSGRRSMIIADSCFGGALLLAGAATLAFFLQGPPTEEQP
jgi:hypothetical protein